MDQIGAYLANRSPRESPQVESVAQPATAEYEKTDGERAETAGKSSPVEQQPTLESDTVDAVTENGPNDAQPEVAVENTNESDADAAADAVPTTADSEEKLAVADDASNRAPEPSSSDCIGDSAAAENAQSDDVSNDAAAEAKGEADAQIVAKEPEGDRAAVDETVEDTVADGDKAAGDAAGDEAAEAGKAASGHAVDEAVEEAPKEAARETQQEQPAEANDLAAADGGTGDEQVNKGAAESSVTGEEKQKHCEPGAEAGTTVAATGVPDSAPADKTNHFIIKIDRDRLPARYEHPIRPDDYEPPPAPSRHIIKIKFSKNRMGKIHREVIPYFPRISQLLPVKPAKKQKTAAPPDGTKLAKGYALESTSVPQAPKLGSEVPAPDNDNRTRHTGAHERAAASAAAKEAKQKREYHDRLSNVQMLLQRLARVASLNNKDQVAERNKPVPIPAAPVAVAPAQARPVPVPRNRALSSTNSDTVSLDRASSSHASRSARPGRSKYGGDFLDDGEHEQDDTYYPPVAPAAAPARAGVAVAPKALPAPKVFKQWDRTIVMGGRGRDADMLQKCRDILNAAMRHKLAWPFNEPVNAKALGLVDYHDIIRSPMDMGTVKSKRYASADDFAADMRLVFDNCMKYNPPASDVHQMGGTVLEFFEKKWIKLIEQSRKPPQLHQPRERIKYKDDDELPAFGEKRSRKSLTAEDRKVRDLEAKLEQMQKQQSLLLQRVNMGGGGGGSSSFGGDFGVPETDSVGGGGTLAADRTLKSFVDPHRAMSLDQKRELSFNFKRLPDEKLLVAVDIIRDNMPVDNDADDIVIDIDSLDNKTLWQLKEFIDKAMPSKKGAARRRSSEDQSHQTKPKTPKKKKQKKAKGSGSDSDSSSSSSSSSDSDSDSDNSSAGSDPGKSSKPAASITSAPATSAPQRQSSAPSAVANSAPAPAAVSSSAPAAGGWMQSAPAPVEKKPFSFSLGGSSKAASATTKKPVELKNTSSWLSLVNKDTSAAPAGSAAAGGASGGNALWAEHQNKARQAQERDQQRHELQEQKRAEEQRALEARQRQQQEEESRKRKWEEDRQQQEEDERESMELKRQKTREEERAARAQEDNEETADSARFETEAGLDGDDDFGLDQFGYGSMAM